MFLPLADKRVSEHPGLVKAFSIMRVWSPDTFPVYRHPSGISLGHLRISNRWQTP